MANTPDANALAKFDIIKFAKNILAEVDQIRAYELIPDDQTKVGVKVPIESRLNAFFRLVGLPMFVTIEDANKKDGAKKANSENKTGTRVLSPGFFGSKFSGKTIKDAETEIEVEGNNRKINTILEIREGELLIVENSIGTEQGNENMTLAIKNSLPLVSNLSDKNNNKYGPVEIGSGTNFKRTSFKKLLPPVTSFKTIMPVSNEVARPFTLEENDRKIDSQTTLFSPFIETVVRIRLLSAANAGSSKEQQKDQDFQISIEVFSDALNLFTNLKANLLENFIISKLAAAFFQLAAKYKEIKKRQEVISKVIDFNISIKTASSQASPFGKRVEADFESDSNAIRKLKDLQNKLAREEILLSLLPTDDELFKTNAKTSNTKNTSFTALINQFGSLITFNSDQLRKAIKTEEEYIKKNVMTIEKLRVEIDMMTGEFTGVSIPDILAVISSLFIIDKRYLVALLDADVITNMKKDKRLESALNSLGASEPSLSQTVSAIKELSKIINDWYKLLDSYITYSEDRNKRARQQVKTTSKKTVARNLSIENK